MRQSPSSPNTDTISACFILFARLSSYIVTVIGLVVIAGWVLGIEAVKSLVPGLATMKFNTALLLLMMGVVFASGETLSRYSRLLAVFVLIAAGLTLAEYAFGWSLGIDQWFVRDIDTINAGGQYPGRMSLMTAFCFILISLSSLFARRERPSQLLAIICGVLALLAVLGYAYDVQALYEIIPYSSMAIHTALAFILLSAAALFSFPRDGLMRIISDTSAGGILIRRLLPAVILLPFLFGWLRLVGERDGLYSSNFGTMLVTIAHIVTYTVLTAWIAESLRRVDSRRADAEAHREETYRELEQRVIERTAALAESNRVLALSENKYRMLVNGIMDYAIYTLDPEGTVTSWTESARFIKGYTQEEIVGRNYATFYTPDDQMAGVPQRNLEIAVLEGHLAMEGWRVRKDQTRFWAGVVITAMRDETGQLIGFSKVTRDLTKQKQAQEKIRHSEALLSAVLDSMPVGVWITDEKGKALRINPAADAIWAGAPFVGIEQYGEYKGWKLSSGKRIESDQWAAARAIEFGETTINEEIEIECFDGTNKIILNSSIPIRDEGEKIIGAVTVNQDITQLKRTEDKLRRSAESLERKNRDLEMFAYTASHDLQEPLRKIRAFGERLTQRSSESLDPKSQEYLFFMVDAASRMQAMIQDLLTYSRISTVTKPFSSINLNLIVASVMTDLELSIQNEQADMQVEPLMEIEADPVQMRQLFQNIISNALKFHAPDRIPVIRISGQIIESRMSAASRQNNPVQSYKITISDNGIGFKSEYSERIFGMFQRLHGRTDYEGTGIGLAICQRIVERHHGTIEAHGVPNEGATFTITLPVHQSPVVTEMK